MRLPVDKQNFLIDLYITKQEELSSKLNFPTLENQMREFVRIATHNKVGANLFLQLKRQHVFVPNALMVPLEETYRNVKLRNKLRLEIGLPILNELKSLGVEVIILKGNAIAEELFDDIGYKPMNDIDILVKKSDLEVIHEIFLKHELLTAAPLEDDIRKQEKYSHHWPPFFNRKLELFLGTHWDISAPTRGITTPIEDFWLEKEEFKLMGQSFHRLAPKHFILHLCIHLNSAKTGLREIGDLVRVIEARQSELDATAFSEMVIKANSVKEVYESLSLVSILKVFVFVDEVLKKLSPLVDDEFKAAVEWRMYPRHKILHIRTNYISKIEKTFALFMLTEAPLEKTMLLAKMWKLYLLVPGDEALRLNHDFPQGSFWKKFFASLIAPIKISQVFIKDMGPLIFTIVTLRHQWVLLKSYFDYVKKKLTGKKIRNLESYAQSMGLTMAEIKEISALD